MNPLRIGGITPMTTIDYPGELAAVVFCQGCPWRCRYCHNLHLLDAGAEPQVAWADMVRFLRRRRGLLDAVVFSGGEPTLQRDLADAIGTVREMGFKVGLHTAGCYPDRLRRILPLLDWVGLDIKAMPAGYPAITGVPGSGERAFESLDLILAAGVAYEVRITAHSALLDPGHTDRLVARVRELGADNVMLQRCDDRHVLDATLPPNRLEFDGGGQRIPVP